MKKVPVFKSDAEAETFLEQDLSDLDFNQFKPMRFEIAQKDAVLTLRVPESLMRRVRARAKEVGIPYSRYVRMVLESDLTKTNHTE